MHEATNTQIQEKPTDRLYGRLRYQAAVADLVGICATANWTDSLREQTLATVMLGLEEQLLEIADEVSRLNVKEEQLKDISDQIAGLKEAQS